MIGMGIEEEIKGMVNEANGISKKGGNNAALQLLQEAWDKANLLPENMAKSLKGLIFHYEGRILQSMARYKDAVKSLEFASEFRKGNLVDYAYTMFQLRE